MLARFIHFYQGRQQIQAITVWRLRLRRKQLREFPSARVVCVGFDRLNLYRSPSFQIIVALIWSYSACGPTKRIYTPNVIDDRNDQPIRSAADVELHPVVGADAGRGIGLLNRLWRRPDGVRGVMIPGRERQFGIWKAFPEGAYGILGNHPHATRVPCSHSGIESHARSACLRAVPRSCLRAGFARQHAADTCAQMPWRLPAAA